VRKLYSSTIGSRLVSHESSNPHIRVLASRDGGRTALFFTNKSPEAGGMGVSIELDGVMSKSASAVSLSADHETAAAFNRQNPPVEHRGKDWSCQLPPYSVTLIEFSE
jgi:hypothetical protein